MKILSNGIWEGKEDLPHGVDAGLAKGLAKFFLQESMSNFDYYSDGISVIDIGCGTGYYTKFLNEYGVGADGFDGNPFTPELTNGDCGVADFSQEQHLMPYHWVLCLEVGEHIPAEYEDVFIGNLHRHNTEGIVLSWAVPKQGGDGHINCKTNEEVQNIFNSLGYYRDFDAEKILKDSCAEYPTPCYWFRFTLMVFRKRYGII